MQKWVMMNGQKWRLKFQDSQNPFVFITTPKEGGPGVNLTAATHAVITEKLCVLTDQ
jgi:hypothetical protein